MDRDLKTLARHNPFLVFVAHQAVVALSAIGFLWTVRLLSGRSIHLGQDPIGPIDGAGLVVLSIAVIAFTVVVYRWSNGSDAPPLGIAVDFRRVAQFAGGLVAGVLIFVWPFAAAVANGQAVESIDGIMGNSNAVLAVSLGLTFLIIQAVTEEVANRAFPMQLWRERTMAFRIIVPSIMFTAIHLMSETPSIERVLVLFSAGVLQSVCYALTANIWLSAGVHAGANFAVFSVSGQWHAGAICSIAGQPVIPNTVNVVLVTLLSILILLISGSALARFPEPHR